MWAEMEIWHLLRFVPTTLGFIVIGIIQVLIAKLVKDLLTPFDVADQLTQKDNPAFGLSLTGYYAGIFAIVAGTIRHAGPGFEYHHVDDFIHDANLAFAYGLAGILLLNLGRVILDRLILPGIDMNKEIIDDRNAGAGAVQFGSYLATGIILAGAISGDPDATVADTMAKWEAPVSALVFFVLGQFVLLLYCRFYEVTARFEVLDEIERDNVPVGVALGGNMVALSIVLLRAVGGAFQGWEHDLATFAVDAALGFIIFFGLRILVDKVFLPGSNLEDEIRRDRNINAALVEVVLLIGGATLIFYAA